jgi:hypothetical protein
MIIQTKKPEDVSVLSCQNIEVHCVLKMHTVLYGTYLLVLHNVLFLFFLPSNMITYGTHFKGRLRKLGAMY